MSNPELVPGLAGIPAAESSISFIDGQAGVLEYRGYKIEDLSAHSTYEEVAWLLLYGELRPRRSSRRSRRISAGCGSCPTPWGR